VKKRRLTVCPHFARRLIEITSRHQQTQRTLLDWLRVEYAIAKPSNKLLAVADLDSDTWVGEVERIRGKKLPLTAAGVQGLREEYTRSIEPARALAAETLELERTLSDLINQANGLVAKGHSGVAFAQVVGYILSHGQRDSGNRSPQTPSLGASTDH
jgi:hypothetical protein